MKRSALAIAIATVLVGSTAFAQSSTQPSTTNQTTRSDDTNGIDRTIPRASTDRNTSRTATDENTTDAANTTSPNRNSTNGAIGSSANRKDGDSTNRSDESFLKDFAQANAAEVETGKMAVDKAHNAEVKSFAKHMVDDHSKTTAKVAAIAGTTNIDVKAEPDTMHKAKAAIINMKGASFDEAYMKQMVDDHEKVVEMLQKEIRVGQDASVKQLASQALPDVQKHLKMAQDLHAKVMTNRSSSRSSSGPDSGDTERVASERK